MRGALLLAVVAACLAVTAAQVKPVPWSAATRARAVRLARHARALRCKWPRVTAWECTDCKINGTRLLAHWISSAQYEDAADAFTIHHDSKQAAIVVTFRSTYNNDVGWLSNFDAASVRRTVANNTYLLHRGMANAYYNTIRGPLFERLKAIRTAGLPAGVKNLIFSGHSRGAMIAQLAAADAVTDRRATLGLGQTSGFPPVALYTFAQARIGDKAFCRMMEDRIGERFRITNTADPVVHIPPTSADVPNANEVLQQFVEGVAAVRIGLPSWLSPLIPDLSPLLSAGYNYWHFGPQILELDYIDPAGVPVRRTIDRGTELVCAEHDLDSVCIAEALKSMHPKAKRRSVGPYAWPGSLGAPTNRWPLFALLDHTWTAGVDCLNMHCTSKKPPGWWGWKLAVGTSTDFLSGTDGDIKVAWTCGGYPATNGFLPLDCKLSLGDLASGEFGNLNCFERGDVDMFMWQHHNGTILDGQAVLIQHKPAATACAAAGAKPVVEIEHTGLLQNWKLASVVLQLGYTVGPDDRMRTHFFGDCTPGVEDPLSFPLGTSRQRTTLCETRPYFAWTARIATADKLGAGSDGDVSMSVRCGELAATRGLVDLHSEYVDRNCGLLNNCWERGDTNTFDIAFDMGRWDPAGPLTPAQYPLPACTAAGVQPVMRLSFKGNGFADAWDLDASKLELELAYISPDETDMWDERTGVLLTRIFTRRFRPCTNPGVVTFPRTSTAITRDFTLCPAGPAARAANPAAAAAALFKRMP